MATVAISGSRGLIGSALVPHLESLGYRVRRLMRSGANEDDIAWSPREPLPPGALRGVDAVVHLAGENIAQGRWSRAKKQRILESRVLPTRLLAEAVTRDGVPTLLSASAVGIYGDRGVELLTESAPLGEGFLAEVGRAWEAAASCPARVVNLRIGVVLSTQGGALRKQLLAFRLGLGAVLGSGRQYLPWIARDDLIGAIGHLLRSSLRGPVNLCSPSPVTNREFGRTLARVMQRPFLLRIPRPILRMLFGELADAALLASLRGVPEKLLGDGFSFRHAELEGALRFLLEHGQ